LVVAKVTSELSRRLGREVPVTHLFEYPTVEASAQQLERGVRPPPELVTGEEVAHARRQALVSRRARRSQGAPR
jgi:hypothetical protein